MYGPSLPHSNTQRFPTRSCVILWTKVKLWRRIRKLPPIRLFQGEGNSVLQREMDGLGLQTILFMTASLEHWHWPLVCLLWAPADGLFVCDFNPGVWIPWPSAHQVPDDCILLCVRASCCLKSPKLFNTLVTLVLFAEPPSDCRASQQLQNEGYLQTDAAGLLLPLGFNQCLCSHTEDLPHPQIPVPTVCLLSDGSACPCSLQLWPMDHSRQRYPPPTLPLGLSYAQKLFW